LGGGLHFNGLRELESVVTLASPFSVAMKLALLHDDANASDRTIVATTGATDDFLIGVKRTKLVLNGVETTLDVPTNGELFTMSIRFLGGSAFVVIDNAAAVALSVPTLDLSDGLGIGLHAGGDYGVFNLTEFVLLATTDETVVNNVRGAVMDRVL